MKGALYICLTLRYKKQTNVPIILLGDLKIESEEYHQLYKQLKFFDQVYYFFGNSSSKNDLKAIGIEKCKVL
jgi:hypothetical protein